MARLTPALQVEVVRRLVDWRTPIRKASAKSSGRWRRDGRNSSPSSEPRRRAEGGRQNPRCLRPGDSRADSRQPRRPRSAVGRAVRHAADRLRGACPIRRCGVAGRLSGRRAGSRPGGASRAPPALLERLLRCMPREEAKRLRHKLENPDPIRLSDVEEARRQIAALAQPISRTIRKKPPPETTVIVRSMPQRSTSTSHPSELIAGAGRQPLHIRLPNNCHQSRTWPRSCEPPIRIRPTRRGVQFRRPGRPGRRRHGPSAGGGRRDRRQGPERSRSHSPSGRRRGMQGRDERVDKMVAGHVAPAIAAIQQTDAELRQAKQAWIAHWETGAVRLAAAIAARVIRREFAGSPTSRFRWCARRWIWPPAVRTCGCTSTRKITKPWESKCEV